MAWEKASVGLLARVNAITGDTTLPAGMQIAAAGINPLAGEKMWDNCATFLNGYGTVSGTWTVEVQGTVAGFKVTATGVGLAPPVQTEPMAQRKTSAPFEA